MDSSRDILPGRSRTHRSVLIWPPVVNDRARNALIWPPGKPLHNMTKEVQWKSQNIQGSKYIQKQVWLSSIFTYTTVEKSKKKYIFIHNLQSKSEKKVRLIQQLSTKDLSNGGAIRQVSTKDQSNLKCQQKILVGTWGSCSLQIIVRVVRLSYRHMCQLQILFSVIWLSLGHRGFIEFVGKKHEFFYRNLFRNLGLNNKNSVENQCCGS